MNTTQFRYVILAVCSATFLYQIWHITSIHASENKLQQDAAALQARVAYRNSASYMVPMILISVFDGFTFGKFADGGIFTTYKQESRFDEKTVETDARLLTAHTQYLAEIHSAALMRNWSLLIGIVVLAYSFFAEKLNKRICISTPDSGQRPPKT